jgi:hypothetical protein
VLTFANDKLEKENKELKNTIVKVSWEKKMTKIKN